MKTTHGWVLAALLSTTAGCAVDDAVELAASSDQGIVAGSGSRGTEMHVSWTARKELADALGGEPDGELDFGEVGVPNVVRVQHQYSIAALRLEAPSWTLVTDLPVEDAPWSTHSPLGVVFPRSFVMSAEPGHQASHAAAEKLFNALVEAAETTVEVVPGVRATTRASARKTFSCTKTTDRHASTSFQCTIRGVTSVGGPGLFWER